MTDFAMAEPSLQLGLRAVWHDRFCRNLLLAGVALHLLLALAFHLSPDETHYALYSVNLDWSYFDHPPMAGWLQWPASHLPWVGGSDLAMRIVPMLCWLAAAWLLAGLSFVLFGQTMAPKAQDLARARAALLLWWLAPMAHLLGLALVPDTLLMPLVLLAMLLTWRLCHPLRVAQWPRWVALGAVLGLTGLSKYTAVFIGLGAALALLLAHGPGLLRRSGPWLGAAVALLLITPVIGWNASHGWISLAYQGQHAAGYEAWLARHALTWLLVQLMGYGLLLAVGLVAARAAIAAPVHQSRLAPGALRLSPLAFSLCFGVPPLLVMLYLSGRGSTLPHWSVTAWLSLVPAAATGCLALWQRRRSWLPGLGLFQALSVAGLLGLMLSGGVQREAGLEAASAPGQTPDTAQFNPFTDLYGWDAAARHASVLARQNGNASLAVMNWTLASRIAWYAQAPTKVVQTHRDQFGLWWGGLQPGESALVVDWSQLSFAPPVGPTEFARCELLAQQPVMHWGRQIAHFNFQFCQHWQGPPAVGAGQFR